MNEKLVISSSSHTGAADCIFNNAGCGVRANAGMYCVNHIFRHAGFGGYRCLRDFGCSVGSFV